MQMYWHFASLRVKNKLKSSGRLNSQHWEDDMFRPPPVRPLHIWHRTMEALSTEFITALGPVEFQLYRIVTYWEVFTCAVLSLSSTSPLIVDATSHANIVTMVPLDRSVSTSWAERSVFRGLMCCWASPRTFTTFYSVNVASMRYCMYSDSLWVC